MKMDIFVFPGLLASAFLALVLCVSPVFAKETPAIEKIAITGAGATFPAPLYRMWIEEFRKTPGGFPISYEAVGSGDGTKKFMAKEVDFGASDSAMTDEQIAKVEGGVQLIPVTAGIIVLAYNLPDYRGDLKLSRSTYTDIFLGRINYWDDERITLTNPDARLPHLNITTVTRNDSSGTTAAFTRHLDAISSEYHNGGPGTGKQVDWPGNSMSAMYNEGVAGKIRNSWGTIGYVEYGTARRAGLSMASLENREGNYIQPDASSGTVTLANTAREMPANLRIFLPDPAGNDSYPIITYSWFLLYKNYADAGKAANVISFVDWGLTKGQDYAADLGYTPLPSSVVEPARKALANIR